MPNVEIRRRLTQEFKVSCPPVTPTTRRVLLLKLAKLTKDDHAELHNMEASAQLEQQIGGATTPDTMVESQDVGKKKDDALDNDGDSLIKDDQMDVSIEKKIQTPKKAVKMSMPLRGSPLHRKSFDATSYDKVNRVIVGCLTM